MTSFGHKQFVLSGLMVVSATLMGLTFTTGAIAGKQQDKDRETCSSMGAPYGSPGYTDCMLQQQQREDDKMRNFLKEQRMHQELGREAREKLEEKRARRERDKWCR
jgi:hypothetical protein